MIQWLFLVVGLIFILTVGVKFYHVKYQELQFKKMALYITQELESRGIKVKTYHATATSCSVIAEPTPDQIEDYQEVYSEALINFPSFAPAEICEGARPLEPLNEDWQLWLWSNQVYIDEYAAEGFTAPCVVCRESFSVGYRWGSQEFHKRPASEHLVYECVLFNGMPLNIFGYLCPRCQGNKEHFQSAKVRKPF